MSAGNTVRAHCLECDPERRKSKSLAITTDERGVVEYCHRCQYTSADNHAGAERPPPLPISDRKSLPAEKIEAIRSRTVPLRGTLGQTYLEHRHCALPPADSDLRYLPGNERFPPSLCALVTDCVTNEPMTLHFTRLAADGRGKAGTERDKTLLAGHPKAGGVIRLWPDEAVTHGLAIAEGLESALAAAHMFTPVWSTVDAGNMKRFPVLDGIEALTIFADNDLAGLDAARTCGRRWRDAGREVRVLKSRKLGHDVADEVAA